MSYSPVVARLEDVQPIPKADRIVQAKAAGFTVVVGVDHQPGELGVVFEEGGVLDPGFALAAGLLREHPETGEKLDGYLDRVPRIKCITLRGVKTDALWMPLTTFVAAVIAACDKNHISADITVASFPEGFEFTDGQVPLGPNAMSQLGGFGVTGFEVAKKYRPPPQQRASGEKKQRDVTPENRRLREYRKAVREAMPEHYDTPPLHRALHQIPYGAQIMATEKAHGTSGCVVRRKLSLPRLKRVANFLARAIRRKPYDDTEVAWGTRRTVQGGPPGSKEHAAAQQANERDYRREIAQAVGHRLKPGECVYFEIVGYTDTGKPIQLHRPKESGADSKAIRDRFGAEIPYAYGCTPDGKGMVPQCDVHGGRDFSSAAMARWGGPPQYRAIAYRVVQDGVDLPFEAMQRRAVEIGFEVFPILGSWSHVVPAGVRVDPDEVLGPPVPNEDPLLNEDGRPVLTPEDEQERMAEARRRLACRETQRRAQELAEGAPDGACLLASAIHAATPREGVVLRVDLHPYTPGPHVVAKVKARGFKLLEGLAHDRGETNVEEQDGEGDATTEPTTDPTTATSTQPRRRRWGRRRR